LRDTGLLGVHANTVQSHVGLQANLLLQEGNRDRKTQARSGEDSRRSRPGRVCVRNFKAFASRIGEAGQASSSPFQLSELDAFFGTLPAS
jgi:hypothetical protein